MKPKQFFFGLIAAMVLIIGGAGAGYYLVVQNLHQRTHILQKSLADNVVAEEKIDQLTGLKKQYNKLLPELQKLEMVLPAAKKQSEFVLQLQQIAADSGMSLPAISFPAANGLPSATSQTTKAGDALAIPVNFQLSGSYDQLQSFLHNLESLDRYTNVNSLSIARTDKPGTLNFSLSINTYLKP